MMKQRVTLFTGIILSLFFLGCESNSNKIVKKENDTKIIKILNLTKSNSFSDTVEFPAQIHPFRNSVLAFELSGKVVEFNYELGQKLKKGDVIAKLDDTIYKSNLKASKANYEKALADYNRYEKLYNSKAIAITRFEQAKQNLDVTKSNYEIAKKNFENTKLVAEFDGILAQKYIDDFARITAKQKIAVLQDNSKFKVKFYVPENDIINEGKRKEIKDVSQNIEIYTSLGQNGKLKYRSQLIDISRKAEDVTRTYEATAVFDNPKNVNILAGMTAKVIAKEINIVNTSVFIPLKALFSDSSKNSFVWLVNSENKVIKTEVKTGRLEKDSIEILDGLKGDESIAISGVNLLQENQKVKAYKKLGN